MHSYHDAINHITTTLGEHASSHDIDAIADAIWDENGGTWDFSLFDADRFWQIVEAKQKDED